VGDEVYLVSDKGIATCLDAKTGEQHWQERLGGNFSASPMFADGRIYFLDEEGVCTVLKPGKTHEVLATNTVPGRTLASLVAADGAIFLRTDTHLYRLQQAAAN
jgi:outer membrane protein assembly factor BamB